MANTHKLYCYIDETGQDTSAQLFIVAVIITDGRRNELSFFLEGIERTSGKHKRKWLKTRQAEREAYFKALLSNEFPGQIYTQAYNHDGPYQDLEVLTAAQALNLYRRANNIADNYKVTVAIDGLSKGIALRVGREFRLLGVKTRVKS
jgi:environmental stress-induced protein Ves